MSKTKPNKSFMLREANPGWIAIALVLSIAAIALFEGLSFTPEVIYWGCALAVMITVILYLMKKYEIVVTAQEVVNRAEARRQSIIVLVLAVSTMLLVIFLTYIGVIPR